MQPTKAIFYDKNRNKLGKTIISLSENKYIVTNYARNIESKQIKFKNFPIDNWAFFILPSGLPAKKLLSKEIDFIRATCLYWDLSTSKMEAKCIIDKKEKISVKAGSFDSYVIDYKFDFILAAPYSSKIWITKEAPHYFLKFELKKFKRTYELSKLEYHNQ